MGYAERISQASEVTRRSFVKAAAAVSALAAVAATGCQGQVAPEEGAEGSAGAEPTPTQDRDLLSGEWVSAACWHNCGGRCLNKVLVQDGVVIRQKTDDVSDDSEGSPQQRSCPRGRAQRTQVFGADRLKYPMKRKNWSPESPNGELRGRDEWERISWDEAIGYVSSELQKVYSTYGPKGVLGCGTNGVMTALNALGGYCSITDSSSLGTYANGTPASLGLAGSWDWGQTVNDRYDLKKSDWVVLHSVNPAWSAPGMPVLALLEAKRAGVQFVSIDPMYSATAQLVNARWIPVKTGTDIAFMMGVAHAMIKLDEERGGVIDWDFLHKYCVGFDADSMPENAATDENFKDYLLGAYDGVEKTAEWASSICGATVEDIEWYAELLGKDNVVAMHHGYAYARAAGTEDVGQMFMTLGCMGGHIGKPGHACGADSVQTAFNAGPSLVTSGATGLAGAAGTIYEPIPAPVVWRSILEGQYPYVGTQYAALDKGETRPLDIHLVAFEAAASLQTTPDMLKGVEALRGMDFVFTSAYSLNTQAKYSDVVLPCTTEWERPGGFVGANRETVIVYSKVTDPLFEAKTDQEIGTLILEACGVDPAPVFDLSEQQQFFNCVAGCMVMGADGQYAPLVTITDADISAWGVQGSAQQGVIGLDDFIGQGFYHVARSEGDAYGFIAYESFIKDPEANPLTSASGKFEIYCQAKADEFNAPGIVTTFKPYPTYQPSVRGVETLSEEYPLLGYNLHYFRRSHSVLDNVPWLREAWPNPVYIAAADAAERDISNGDPVCISSPHGKTIRTACVMESLIPGVVCIPHGAWIEMDEKEEYDLAGADNVLMGNELSASAVSGYNNINVNIEKYAGEVVPDCEWPQRIIEL